MTGVLTACKVDAPIGTGKSSAQQLMWLFVGFAVVASFLVFYGKLELTQAKLDASIADAPQAIHNCLKLNVDAHHARGHRATRIQMDYFKFWCQRNQD